MIFSATLRRRAEPQQERSRRSMSEAGSLRRHRRQLEHAAVFGGFGDVAALQSETNRFELLGDRRAT